MQHILDAVEDSELNNVSCNFCHGFLSVPPSSFGKRNGTNICGRCISTFKKSSIEYNYCFEVLAKQFLFPCTYSVVGCRIAQPFEKIGDHEKFCTYRTSKCFCSWIGNSYDFIKHYEDKHKELIVEVGEIFSVTNTTYYLLLKSQGLFFCATCLYENGTLEIFISGLTHASQGCNVTFTCKQVESNLSAEIIYNTLQKLKYNETLSKFILTVEVPIEVVNNILKSIECPNCSVKMTPPILKCSAGHITCVQCLDAWLDYCKACDTERELTCDSELQCTSLSVKFSCRWDCGNNFSYSEIREHEQGCTKRIYNCWHSLDCSWNGYLSELIEHDKSCLLTLYGTEEKCLFSLNVPEVTFPGTTNTRSIHHLIVYNCCFNVIFDRNNGVTSVYVNHYDIYGFGWFRFLVELSHTEHVNCKINKTYRMSHSRGGGIYALSIPESDLVKFNGCQYYKITPRIILLDAEERKSFTNTIYQHFRNYSGI